MTGQLAGLLADWSFFALGGLSLVVVFKTTGVFNLAQGGFMLVSAYVAATIASRVPSPWLALLLVLLIQLPLGYLLYRMLARASSGQKLWTAAIATLGLEFVLDALSAMLWRSGTYLVPSPSLGLEIRVGELALPQSVVLGLAIALALWAAVLAIQKWTRWGLWLRATGENPVLASQVGVPIRRVFALAWIAGLSLAAVAALLYSYRNGANPGLVPLGLAMLAPAMLGGLDSLGGVFVGAAGAAIVQRLSVTQLGGGAGEPALFLLILLVLLIRPYGLFGTASVERS